MACHLTFQEREILYRMKKSGNSQAEIADALGRARSTIWRELDRNTGGRGYRPKQAQQLAEVRRKACRRAAKMNHPEVKKYVTSKLKKSGRRNRLPGE